MPGRPRSLPDRLNAPLLPDAAARLDGQQVSARDECVGRAGHRLDSQGTATCVGAERIAGEHLQPAIPGPGPERDLGVGAGQPGPGAPVLAGVQAGERGIQRGTADRAALTEVILRPGNLLRASGRDAAVVGGLPAGGRKLQLPVVDGAGAGPQVRMRAGAEWRRTAAGVTRRDGYLESRLGSEPVARAQLQAERVARPPEQPEAKLDVVRRRRREAPGGEPGETVNGVVVGRLGYVELVAAPAEGVPSVVDPVRPGGQKLPGARGRDLVGVVPGDDRLAAGG